MPRKVVIRKWSPPNEPMTLTISYAVPDPAKLATIMVKQLQAQVLGGGCHCFSSEELIGNLQTLGVEVDLVEATEGQDETGNRHVN